MAATTVQQTPETASGMEQQLLVDGCKVTLRFSAQKRPNCMAEIKSLLLSAQFKGN